ncbi:hypothetical protein [Modestobacter roseus]|uniref:Transcriptional regulator, AbiEi antitoxin, Type IV TA system n=1 Tax=Modestobacter roseus TaxID=1181884 RepID=A0A562ISJ4_9ACTN|nr:hypothetical protein [Modestobacter roseus]MQA33834.1 hypothetical protein [Modestobacter roseus]TWH73997.1 Transcriptional regulator, AbiEi antitoxin, Type IV TA system [Modestobacter roseus]
MVAPAHRPPALRGRVFRGTTAVRAGLVTRRQLDSSPWHRLFRDVYACADLAVTHELRAVAAASVLLPGAVVTGASAAVLWRLDAAGPDDDVELTVPPGTPARAVSGLRVRRARIRPEDLTRRRGVPVTTPERTAVSLGAERPLDEAVVLIDQFAAAGLVDLGDVRAMAAATTGRGCRRARDAAALADGLAGSPQETRLRLLVHRSGLPLPVAQHPVHDGRVFVARVDFAWPAQRLALEYDGLWHAEPGQFAADRRRLNRLLAAGWRVLFVTAADLHRPDRLIARIAAELAR